mgnify:CR=1 FL=1
MPTAAVLFTGGKDSVYALHKAIGEGLEVKVLVSAIPHYNYSLLYHRPSYTGLLAQAQSLSMPLETIGLYDPRREIEALYHLLRRVREKYGVEVAVTGGIKSRFQLKAFSEAASRVGLRVYAPCWGFRELDYMAELLRSGIKFIVVSITSMGIPHSLLGKVFTENDLDTLSRLSARYGFNISFEGGEAETFVVDAPLFKYRLLVHGETKIVSEFEGYYEIRKISLVKKV